MIGESSQTLTWTKSKRVWFDSVLEKDIGCKHITLIWIDEKYLVLAPAEVCPLSPKRLTWGDIRGRAKNNRRKTAAWCYLQLWAVAASVRSQSGLSPRQPRDVTASVRPAGGPVLGRPPVEHLQRPIAAPLCRPPPQVRSDRRGARWCHGARPLLRIAGRHRPAPVPGHVRGCRPLRPVSEAGRDHSPNALPLWPGAHGNRSLNHILCLHHRKCFSLEDLFCK